MALVVPTVLASNPDQYSEMLTRAESLSQRVHVDICDGQFADAATVNLAQVHVAENTQLDLHLMLKDPVIEVETALSLRPNLIIFHAEATGAIRATMQHICEFGIKAGVALLPDTSAESARTLIEVADHVLIFTGTLGHNGGAFRADQLAKINEVKIINPDVEVGVDGGISDSNAALVAMQGADVLYVGSYLQMATDPPAAYTALAQMTGAAV